jgi:hypothetical protein
LTSKVDSFASEIVIHAPMTIGKQRTRRGEMVSVSVIDWLESPRGSRLAASALLCVPAALLSLLGIGEMAGGDVSGLQHFVEAVPLILLLAAGWFWPHQTGIVLLCIGTLALLAWLVFLMTVSERASPIAWAVVGVSLFLPPFLAGTLFLRGSS